MKGNPKRINNECAYNCSKCAANAKRIDPNHYATTLMGSLVSLFTTSPEFIMEWSHDAEKTLKEVPFFIRPVVRKSIEKMAASDGKTMVDTELYARAKAARGR